MHAPLHGALAQAASNSCGHLESRLSGLCLPETEGLRWAQVMFCLPTSWPLQLTTLNFAPVGLGLTLVGALAAYFAPWKGAKHWYRWASCLLSTAMR